MFKRGQLTIFIILTIILIGIIILFFTFQDDLIKRSLSPEAESISNFVYSCIEETAKKGDFFLAMRGGYFNLPDNYFTGFPVTSYWLYKCEDNFPNKEIIENEISEYIDSQLDYCLLSYDFPEKVKFGHKEIKTKIKEEKSVISIQVNMPTSIILENSVVYLKDYNYEPEEINLMKFLLVSNKLVNVVKKDYSYLDFTSLFLISDENEIDLSIDSYNENTFIFKLKDRYNEEYVFNFVVNLEC